ncbi:MAG: glycosyltransferase family 2 protein, partial [Nocardioidaceae bacterium]
MDDLDAVHELRDPDVALGTGDRTLLRKAPASSASSRDDDPWDDQRSSQARLSLQVPRPASALEMSRCAPESVFQKTAGAENIRVAGCAARGRSADPPAGNQPVEVADPRAQCAQHPSYHQVAKARCPYTLGDVDGDHDTAFGLCRTDEGGSCRKGSFEPGERTRRAPSCDNTQPMTDTDPPDLLSGMPEAARRPSGQTPSAAACRPTVSAVIVVFNQAQFIADAIRSALAQSDVDVEVIVVDDASTDDTPAVLASLGDRITVLRNETGTERGAARNRGARAGRGEFIAFLDGDDCWMPGKLIAQVKLCRLGQACVTQFDYVDSHGRLIGGCRPTAAPTLAEVVSGPVTLGAGSNLMVTREMFEQTG